MIKFCLLNSKCVKDANTIFPRWLVVNTMAGLQNYFLEATALGRKVYLLYPRWKSQILANYRSFRFSWSIFSTRCNALWRLLGSVNICCFSRLGCHEDRGRFFFLKLRKKWTYMLSQNLVRVLGFSWLRLCRNQRWMLRTSQSSCLESPSNRFSSGCYETRHQKKIFLSIFFYLHHLQVLGYIWLNFPSNFYCRHFNIYDWESSPSIWSMNKDNTYITHYETRQKNKNLAPMLAYFLISKDFLWSNQQLREEEPASWLSQSHQTSREEFTETSTHTSPSQRKKRKYIFTL